MLKKIFMISLPFMLVACGMEYDGELADYSAMQDEAGIERGQDDVEGDGDGDGDGEGMPGKSDYKVVEDMDSLTADITVPAGESVCQGLAQEDGDCCTYSVESMGLSTSRSGGAGDDDTSGADVDPLDGYLDCQPNGIDDGIDIGSGGSPDDNANGIPDECEPPGARFCFCDSTTAPCSNPDVDAGSTGKGARLD